MSYRRQLLRGTAFLLVLTLFGSACHRDPNYAKQQYLKSGDKYFDRKRYKEALIMYRKALAADPKFGEAYYHLGLTYEALGEMATVVGFLRRATELLPKGSPEWNNAALKLGSLLVQAAIMSGSQSAKPLLDEVDQLQSILDAKAPNSFEDYRLRAELDRAKAAKDMGQRDVPALKQELGSAVTNLRKSSELRPNDVPTSLALARTLALNGSLKESEQIYEQLIQRDKTLTPAYVELFRVYLLEKRSADAERLMNSAIANNPKNFTFRTLLASYYFTHRDPANMARVLDDMKAHAKEFPEAYLTAGDFYARIGDLNAALQQYRDGEKNDPAKKADYGKREVEILVRQGKTDEAFNRVNEMLKANPKDADAKGLQASFALDRGEINQAITEFQEVVAQKPDNFVAHYDLGRALATKGEYQRAIQQYQESLRIRPDYLRPRLALAQAQLQIGANDAAQQTAQEIERLTPNSGSARLIEGITLMRKGNVAEARKIFTELEQKYPKFPDVYLQLGTLDMMAKNYGEARDEFEKGEHASPNDLRPILGQAESLIAQNEMPKALSLVGAAVAAHPERADYLKAYAMLKVQAGQYDSAQADLQAVLDHFKESSTERVQTYASLGQLNYRKGDYAAAIGWLEKAHAAQPNSIPILLALAQANERAARTAESQSLYRQVLALDPGNGQALNNLAFSLSQSSANLNEALTLATRAKQALPNSLDVDDTLAEIYLKKNMPDMAIDTLKRITTKNPANPAFHYHYCIALYQKGNKADAQKECNAALASKPNQKDAEAARQLLAKLQ